MLQLAYNCFVVATVSILLGACGDVDPAPVEPAEPDAEVVAFKHDSPVRPTSMELDGGLPNLAIEPDAQLPDAPPQPACDPEETFFDGACYSAPGMKWMTFEVAKQVCIGRNAEVASIHSAAENDFVFSLLAVLNQGAWIGLLRDESGFYWDNGEPTDFIDWAAGEPNNEGGEEACTIMWGPNLKSHPEWQGKWNDASCEEGQDTVICKRLL